MNYYVLLPLCGFIANIILGSYIIYRNPKNSLNIFFSLFLFAVSLWALGDFFVMTSSTVEMALLLNRVGAVGSSTMSVFLLHFLLIFTKNNFLSKKIFHFPLYPFLYLPALFFLLTGLLTNFITKDLIDFFNTPNIEIQPLNIPLKKDDIFTPETRKKIPKKAFRSKALLFALRIYYFLKFGKKKKDIIHDTDYVKNDLRLILWNLSVDETNSFVKLCKQHRVSVHSAISTIFLPEFSTINNPVNLRNKLSYPIGEAFGLYASGAVVKMKYKENQDFWDNARRYQIKL